MKHKLVGNSSSPINAAGEKSTVEFYKFGLGMYNVTLISTEHRASGKCNSEELIKILESINPDLIFEEETDDDQYHKKYNDQQNSYESLEIQSIKKYLQNHSIKHIPVDVPNQYLSFQEWDYLFDTLNSYNVYKRLVTQHCALRDKEGFSYLNSNKCLELFNEMELAKKQIIEFSGLAKSTLLRINELFNKDCDNREDAMLRNIFAYSMENQFDRAVFLLGYAHRKSIMQKILKHQKDGSPKLNWALYGDS